jgi:hypothetical protein
MSLALIDVPRCLEVHTSYVGPPRALAPSARKPPTEWATSMNWGGTVAYRRQAAKECLDTIGVLRGYREPIDGEGWLVPAGSERRLLAQVNAIVALGPPALEQVIELSLDSSVPDPGRVFAALLVIGCVEGADWLQRGQDIFTAAVVRNPAEAGAGIEAMSLAPHPGIRPLLAPFLRDERTGIRSSVTRVLALRGELTQAEWAQAVQHREPAIAAAALVAPLRGYDAEVCERTLRPLLEGLERESLMRLALRAGLSLRLGAAHSCAVVIARSDPSWAESASIMAMFGYLDDVRQVRELLDGPTMVEAMRAAAILGNIAVVPDLLEVLNRDAPPEIEVVARDALTTITGVDFVAVPDADQALALWSRQATHFESGVRYRHGRPLGLQSLLQLLRNGPGSRKARQNIYLEMQAATESRLPPFSAYDFVGRQDESLRRIAGWLAEPAVSH